jgi:tetratricopeptide (TPR) repeat protein
MIAFPQRFAELLTEAIRRIHAREGKAIRAIQDELGYLLGREGGAAVEHWRKGRIVPPLPDVERLARALVQRGLLDQAWLEAFLRSAGHPAPALLCAELFPNAAPAASLAPEPAEASAPGLPADPEQRLAALPLRTLPNPAPLPAGSRMPLSRNPLFVGRTQDLLALAALLKHGQTTAVYQVETAAATGLGGIGKTQLASEFVHRFGQYFAGGVFWLSFDTPETVAAEVAACGGAGALDLRPDFARRELEEQVRLVQAAWQEPVPRLLVFDNCEDPELLVRWRPTSGGCRILVTSRRGEWETVLGVQVHPLGVLNRAESLALLAKHQVEASPEVLDALAEELGDLPLALHLAGRYLYRYRRVLAPTEYLRDLRDAALHRHTSLEAGGISPTAHVQHVGRTFAFSYERLDDAQPPDPLARQLLVRLAQFAPGEPVPLELLDRTFAAAGGQPSKVAVEDAVARLLELGLVEVDPDGALRLHRLVAAFVRDAASALAEAAQAAVEQVVETVLQQANEAGAPLALLNWQVHLRYVVEHALERQDERAARLSFALARHLWLLGDYSAARTAAEQALRLRQMLLGEAHLDTAATYQLLGIIEEAQGELAAPEVHFRQALALYLELVGELHIEVADVLTDLASLLWSQRRVGEAMAHARRALAICARLTAGDQAAAELVAAEAANNLATCLTIGLDDAAAARPYMEQSLAIRRARLGEEHPFTALAYNNLGSVLQRLGEPAAAQAHFLRALAIRRRVLGDLHPDTAHSLITLGELLAQQGQRSDARDYLRKALAICQATVGDDHFLTVRAREGLSALDK